MVKQLLPYVRTDSPVFFAWRGEAYVMEELHQHNDLELNFLLSGEVAYLYRGGLFHLPCHKLVAFWGSTPHRVVKVSEQPELITAQVPAAWLMDWGLPRPFMERFLHGALLVEEESAHHDLDLALMRRWARDFKIENIQRIDPHNTVLLEIRSRVHRLASEKLQDLGVSEDRRGLQGKGWRQVERIAHYLAENFKEPLTISEISEGVGLQPSYMMHLFRDRCGVSVLDYLTSFRLAHAQHLLATTDATVLDVALDSGFGSLSRFYAVFKRSSGTSPAKYRKAFRR